MKTKIILLIITFIAFNMAFSQGIDLKVIEKDFPKPLSRMVVSEIDELVKKISSSFDDKEMRLLVYSYLALETPYVFGCLGEGINGKFDKDPLIDFARYDCMTFCEEMLALAISDDFEETFNNLQKIRYKEGKISFKTRNHYTMADWLPENKWLLRDATMEIGGGYCKRLTRTINRHKLLGSNGCYEFDGVPGAAEYTIDYIPKEKLAAVKDRLRGGEIFTVIQNMEGIFSAHMGLVAVDKDHNIIFRHASSAKGAMIAVDMNYEEYLNSLLERDRILGMVFMKIRK
ncbi:N-acetylmuramoyl-L-alanine amidase-like domain-containing protein [candidate division KSB1 bacterium]